MIEVVEFIYLLQLDVNTDRPSSHVKDEELRQEFHVACDRACNEVLEKRFDIVPKAFENRS